MTIRQSYLLVGAVFTIILVVLAGLLASNLQNLSNNQNSSNSSTSYTYQGYDKTINRYYSNSNQGKALNLSETFDYSRLLGVNDGTRNLNNSDVWVDYINNETLNFIDSYAALHKNNAHITLNYTSWVYEFVRLQIKKDQRNFSIIANGIDYASTNVSQYQNTYSKYFINNSISNWFYREENDFNLTYNNAGYIVDMKLGFYNVFGPLGATFTDIRQTLIFDTNFHILNIFYKQTTAIS